MILDYVGIRNNTGSLTVNEGVNLTISREGNLSSLGHLDVKGTLTNNGTINLGCSSEPATKNLITVSGGTITKGEDGLGKINIIATGTSGTNSPIRMTGGVFENQTLDIKARASFIGVGPFTDDVEIRNNSFHMMKG